MKRKFMYKFNIHDTLTGNLRVIRVSADSLAHAKARITRHKLIETEYIGKMISRKLNHG